MLGFFANLIKLTLHFREFLTVNLFPVLLIFLTTFLLCRFSRCHASEAPALVINANCRLGYRPQVRSQRFSDNLSYARIQVQEFAEFTEIQGLHSFLRIVDGHQHAVCDDFHLVGHDVQEPFLSYDEPLHFHLLYAIELLNY